MDPLAEVMKKCTLCVDRIYNENLPEEDRIPSCVRTCPSGARHFGDFADPNSAVSKLVAERGSIELMPELGTKPVNRYLPPRPKDQISKQQKPTPTVAETADGFFAWLDKTLERLG
jgi:Fe-S-cluster-containing dehydrogenase component